VNSSQTIVWMIIVCIIFTAGMSFSKQLKAILTVGVQALFGIFAMFVANFALSPIGISVGINFITVIVVGILGAPGFLTLYILQAIL